MAKTNRKIKKRPLRLREGKKALTFNALTHSLKHVRSSGPYTRDEMSER